MARGVKSYDYIKVYNDKTEFKFIEFYLAFSSFISSLCNNFELKAMNNYTFKIFISRKPFFKLLSQVKL